jgi:hypothetical protein
MPSLSPRVGPAPALSISAYRCPNQPRIGQVEVGIARVAGAISGDRPEPIAHAWATPSAVSLAARQGSVDLPREQPVLRIA